MPGRYIPNSSRPTGVNVDRYVDRESTFTGCYKKTPVAEQNVAQHWHGLFQETTNWADGASFVTQHPITPTRSFLYKFSVPDQAGTFWRHSHLSMQYCDGLRGLLVVYDPNDPHKALYGIDNGTSFLTYEIMDANNDAESKIEGTCRLVSV